MIIKKKYHFYASHRNELLNDKCRNIHGHTYYVEIELSFADEKDGVSYYLGEQMLFSEIDVIIDPIIKNLDHCMLINVLDPLLPYLAKYIDDTKDQLKFMVFNCPTSAENVAKHIFDEVQKQLPISLISLQETTSSTVIYNG